LRAYRRRRAYVRGIFFFIPIEFFFVDKERERERESAQQRARASSIQSCDHRMTLTMQEAEESKEVEGLRMHADKLLSLASTSSSSSRRRKAVAAEGLFECKTCRKRFPSFQALGGHRTSHTRLQARMLSDPPPPAVAERPRTHECAVCGLEFSMGQALGGHMRRHRGEAPPLSVTDATAQPDQAMPDLNFPPPLEEDDGGSDGRRTDQEPSSSGGDQPQLLNLLV
jgi:hypothetical protein